MQHTVSQLNSKLINNLADGVTEFVIGEHLAIIVINGEMNISNTWKQIATTKHPPTLNNIVSVISADNGIYTGRISVFKSGTVQVAFPDLKVESTKTVQGEILYMI